MVVLAFEKKVEPDEAVAEIVKTLESLLERAITGEIRAISYTTVGSAQTLASGWDGDYGTRDSLGFSIMLLQHRFADSTIRSGDD